MAFGYYQNPYTNSYYGSHNYMPYPTQQQVSQPVQQQLHQPVQQSQPQTLYGKVVDCYETAKGQDIPLGITGIYPKADGTCVYVKQWLNDGTTKTSEYRLYVDDDKVVEQSPINIEEKLDDIYKSIDSLNQKLDKMKVETPNVSKNNKEGK